jgi:SAM-dependent methyltransferase
MNKALRARSHYEKHDLIERVTSALSAAAMSGRTLSVEELAPLDQFHFRGLSATSELADRLTVHPQTNVVDLGSGLGGPSRYLAARFGCKVHGIDLTPSFVETARLLTDLCGLREQVTFSCANALDLPFKSGSVDLVWTQHVAMNIRDRAALYREVFRVLRLGGTLAIYDVVAGPNGPVHFPVPWAQEPAASFLLTADAMATALEDQGFSRVSWSDKTDASITWLDGQDSAARTNPSFGLQVINGPDFGVSVANLGRSLREGRAALLEAVFEKTGC